MNLSVRLSTEEAVYCAMQWDVCYGCHILQHTFEKAMALSAPRRGSGLSSSDMKPSSSTAMSARTWPRGCLSVCSHSSVCRSQTRTCPRRSSQTIGPHHRPRPWTQTVVPGHGHPVPDHAIVSWPMNLEPGYGLPDDQPSKMPLIARVSGPWPHGLAHASPSSASCLPSCAGRSSCVPPLRQAPLLDTTQSPSPDIIRVAKPESRYHPSGVACL